MNDKTTTANSVFSKINLYAAVVVKMLLGPEIVETRLKEPVRPARLHLASFLSNISGTEHGKEALIRNPYLQ